MKVRLVASYEGSYEERDESYGLLGMVTSAFFRQAYGKEIRLVKRAAEIDLGETRVRILYDDSSTDFTELHEIEMEGEESELSRLTLALNRLYASAGFRLRASSFEE